LVRSLHKNGQLWNCGKPWKGPASSSSQRMVEDPAFVYGSHSAQLDQNETAVREKEACFGLLLMSRDCGLTPNQCFSLMK
jgi:hypothetical protein